MSLQIPPAPSTSTHVVDIRSLEFSEINVGRPQRSNLAENSVEKAITLSLTHLDVAFAVQVDGSDAGNTADGHFAFKFSAERLKRSSIDRNAAPQGEAQEDSVIHRLSDALAATEAADDRHSAICADALRLAILTWKLSREADRGRHNAPLACNYAGRGIRSLQKWRLKRVIEFVDGNLSSKITLHDLAAVAGLSRMHFAAQFRATLGMRPREYVLKRRIQQAQELLKAAAVSLVDVALTVGFQSQAHFTTVFRRFVGDTPYQWRSAYLAESTPLPPARTSLS